MINKARYSLVCRKATEFIKTNNITSFPTDIFKIAKQNGWDLYPYSELATLGMPISELKRLYGKDGSTSPNNGNYIILYNDDTSEVVNNRITFTIAHEIGHIFLNHLTEFNSSNITVDEYIILDKEANSFARNILAPAEVVYQLNLTIPTILSNIFHLTVPASKTRLDLLHNDLYHLSNKDKSLQKNFFYNFIHKKHCLKCNHSFMSETAKYCPICGHDKLKWGDGKMIYKNGVDLYENNHAIICPKCENEELGQYDTHCSICGTYLIQECADKIDSNINGNEYVVKKCCGNTNIKSNARYCFECGNETTFYKYGYLKKWKKEKSDTESESIELPF